MAALSLHICSPRVGMAHECCLPLPHPRSAAEPSWPDLEACQARHMQGCEAKSDAACRQHAASFCELAARQDG